MVIRVGSKFDDWLAVVLDDSDFKVKGQQGLW